MKTATALVLGFINLLPASSAAQGLNLEVSIEQLLIEGNGVAFDAVRGWPSKYFTSAQPSAAVAAFLIANDFAVFSRDANGTLNAVTPKSLENPNLLAAFVETYAAPGSIYVTSLLGDNCQSSTPCQLSAERLRKQLSNSETAVLLPIEGAMPPVTLDTAQPVALCRFVPTIMLDIRPPGTTIEQDRPFALTSSDCPTVFWGWIEGSHLTLDLVPHTLPPLLFEALGKLTP
jgi:hypothetical protein